MNGTRRELTLRITSVRKAKTIWIKLHDVRILAASINGKRISPADAFPESKDWNLIYWNVPDDGLVFSVQFSSGPIDLSVCDISDELPPLPGGVPLKPRPDDLMPASWFDHLSFVGKSFHL